MRILIFSLLVMAATVETFYYPPCKYFCALKCEGNEICKNQCRCNCPGHDVGASILFISLSCFPYINIYLSIVIIIILNVIILNKS